MITRREREASQPWTVHMVSSRTHAAGFHCAGPFTLELGGSSFPGLGGLKEATMFPPHPIVKLSIVGSLSDREVACSVLDLQGLNFECCVRRQCHLNYLTILRRVPWPILACMCTNVA